MKSREPKFLERKAAGEEAARWLQPHADRATTNGQKDGLVSTRDLHEILAYVRSVEARWQIEFQGKRLGFARPEDMRLMLAGKIKGICVKGVKGKQFNCPITYIELPEWVPEPEKELQVEEQ